MTTNEQIKPTIMKIANGIYHGLVFSDVFEYVHSLWWLDVGLPVVLGVIVLGT